MKTYFCAVCGSPAVNTSPIVGGEASCRSCGWKGPQAELLAHATSTGFTSREDVMREFARDLEVFCSKHAVDFARFLQKWGFLPAAPTTAQMRAYLVGIARGIASGIVRTREEEVTRQVRSSAPSPKTPKTT